MYNLGIFYSVFPDGEMNIPRALLLAAVGFLLVFAVLGVLAVFIKLLGKGFDKSSKKALSTEKVSIPDSAAEGSPLPKNESQGKLILTDVSEEEAALIMAIVSNKSGVPLNRLQFNSIKLLEEDK